MKKRKSLLIVFSMIVIISIILLIPMINYVITFDEMWSFMTLNEAIVTVICLFIALFGAATGINLVALKMKNIQVNKK